MHLKRLELLGFKSFADKVEIQLQPGITAVVGPNGCGKSNIADALRWALGEQSLKALRGAKNEDVIFAGSETRKPLGLAEVELVLDNGDGYLPVDYSEVAVTRRLYRSGESDFLLNKSAVRLRDIQEMFLDTGLGKEAYSVIGQGKIDAILSARPEDRRAIFEEAAGVVKYKMRKASAMRRLEETEANLLRVMDLLAEIESQLGPLREQAALAEQNQRLTAELTRLDVNLIGRDLAAALEAIRQDEDGLERIGQRDGELEREETVLEAALEELRLNALRLDEDLSSNQGGVYALGNRSEQERGRLELVREKMRAQEERLKDLGDLKAALQARLQELEEQRAEQVRALETTGQARIEAATSLAEAEGTIARRDSAIKDLLSREEALRVEIIEDMNKVAAAKNELQANRLEREFLSRAQEELAAKSGALARERDELAEKLAGAVDEFHALVDAEQSLGREEEALAEARRSLQASLAGLEAKNQDWRGRIKGIESRLGLLEEMERTYQGYFPGVRTVLTEAGSEPFARGIKGLVAELITVKAGYELAIEVALGSALQFVVIADDQAAQEAIAFLKKTGRGRATFLPLNMVRGSRASAPGLAEAIKAHGASIAADLVEFAPEYRGIIDHLLGATIIAPNLAQAVALSKRIGKSLRVVTKEGEVIGVGGAMTGGALDQRKLQILGRKREIEELLKEKDTALSFLAKGQAEADRARQEIGRLEARLAEAAVQRRDMARALASARSAVENLEAARRKSEDDWELLQFQLRENEQKTAEAAGKEEGFLSCLSAAEESLERHRRELAEVAQELREGQHDKDAALQNLGIMRAAAAARAEEEKKHREALAATERQAKELAREIEARIREESGFAASMEALRREEAETQEALARLAGEIREKEEALQAIQAERSELQQSQRRTDHRLRALRRERQDLAEQGRRLEVALGEWRVRAGNYREHLLQEYGPGWESRLEADWDMERGEAAARIEELRAGIRALGPVNPGAIGEYETTRARHEFLQRQSGDLTEARESLQRIIAEVERTISRRFLDTFEAVRANFIALFRRLFEGGKADLILIDPDNPLESGIEVVAQPPGKRLQSLSLLSGGERAMIAIALLFAILQNKPAPFCILDEIDATLDEANVARFAELLTLFSESMQFIVITHRRGTMEVADSLYGVTMEEMGVSKIISLQLKEKAG